MMRFRGWGLFSMNGQLGRCCRGCEHSLFDRSLRFHRTQFWLLDGR